MDFDRAGVGTQNPHTVQGSSVPDAPNLICREGGERGTTAGQGDGRFGHAQSRVQTGAGGNFLQSQSLPGRGGWSWAQGRPWEGTWAPSLLSMRKEEITGLQGKNRSSAIK